MENCVEVFVNSLEKKGCITRRLNAEEYEIWMEDGSVVLLSPDEFEELKKEWK